jgi:hypothetical protein
MYQPVFILYRLNEHDYQDLQNNELGNVASDIRYGFTDYIDEMFSENNWFSYVGLVTRDDRVYKFDEEGSILTPLPSGATLESFCEGDPVTFNKIHEQAYFETLYDLVLQYKLFVEDESCHPGIIKVFNALKSPDLASLKAIWDKINTDAYRDIIKSASDYLIGKPETRSQIYMYSRVIQRLQVVLEDLPMPPFSRSWLTPYHWTCMDLRYHSSSEDLETFSDRDVIVLLMVHV